MSEQLIIGLSGADAGEAQWLVVDAQGSAGGKVTRGPLDAVASQAADRRVCLVLHDMQVTRTQCNLPVGGSKLARALPYALEDQFAEDVELLHFAAGAADDDGNRAVSAIARASLDDCLARMHEAGIFPAAIYTTHDSLTPLAGFTQLLVADGSVIVRAVDGQVAGLDGVAPADALDAWRATQGDAQDASERVNVRVYCDATANERFAEDWQRIRATDGDVDIKLLADGWLPFAARAIASGHGINLLQGAYAIKSDALASLRPWFAAAAMLLVVLALGLVNRAVDYRELKRQSATLDSDIGALLANVQRGGANAANPEAQLAALLNRQQRSTSTGVAGDDSDTQFLDTLRIFATAARTNKVSAVDAIAYRNGTFDVRLTAPDASTLEALTRQVSAADGLDARIQRTEQQDDSVKSFVQITGVQP